VRAPHATSLDRAFQGAAANLMPTTAHGAHVLNGMLSHQAAIIAYNDDLEADDADVAADAPAAVPDAWAAEGPAAMPVIRRSWIDADRHCVGRGASSNRMSDRILINTLQFRGNWCAIPDIHCRFLHAAAAQENVRSLSRALAPEMWL
jgi:hypothetical protein